MNNDFLYNNSNLKDRRKDLRNKATEYEILLWKHLKHSKLSGYKFTRQYGAGPYILDFFCPKIRLAIELDGNQHWEEENIVYDKDRELYLESIDIKTLRFWNYEIKQDISNVITRILAKTQELEAPS